MKIFSILLINCFIAGTVLSQESTSRQSKQRLLLSCSMLNSVIDNNLKVSVIQRPKGGLYFSIARTTIIGERQSTEAIIKVEQSPKNFTGGSAVYFSKKNSLKIIYSSSPDSKLRRLGYWTSSQSGMSEALLCRR